VLVTCFRVSTVLAAHDQRWLCDNPQVPNEVWGAGEPYEAYVGRWSRQVASVFCEWLEPEPDRRWLDVGCGTGALSKTLAGKVRPANLVSVDPSLPYVAYARAGTTHKRTSFAVGDALAIPLRNGSTDYVVSGLVLNFVTDPGRALEEMHRVTRPGGTVAAYVWDYAEKMQFMRHFWDAAASLDAAAGHLDEGGRFPICRPDGLVEAFQAAQLSDVRSRGIEIPTVFANFDDYWTPFLGGQGPAPGYAMSLPEKSRTQLRERLRATLPARDDGSIALVARAWAVRGQVL
jgi:SAM-dependent methyltransferase